MCLPKNPSHQMSFFHAAMLFGDRRVLIKHAFVRVFSNLYQEVPHHLQAQKICDETVRIEPYTFYLPFFKLMLFAKSSSCFTLFKAFLTWHRHFLWNWTGMTYKLKKYSCSGINQSL